MFNPKSGIIAKVTSSFLMGQFFEQDIDISKSLWIAWRLDVACVCVFWVVWIANPLLVRIQSWFKSNPFEKISILQRSDKQTSCFIVSIGCLLLSVFETCLTKLKLVDFVIKPIQSVVSTIQLIAFWKSLTKFVKFGKSVLIVSKLIWLLR